MRRILFIVIASLAGLVLLVWLWLQSLYLFGLRLGEPQAAPELVLPPTAAAALWAAEGGSGVPDIRPSGPARFVWSTATALAAELRRRRRGIEPSQGFALAQSCAWRRVNGSGLLFGQLRSPGRYHPERHPDLARQRRNEVLERMVENGALPADRLPALQAAPLGTGPRWLRGPQIFR